MADLGECSRPTIQAIELTKLKLSEKLAVTLSAKTGVSMKWLMDGDVTAPPVDRANKPYTRETFERARAKDTSDPNRFSPDHFGIGSSVASCLPTIFRAALAAHRASDVQLFSYRLTSAISEVAGKYPGYEDLYAKWVERLTEASRENHREEAVAIIYLDFVKALTAETNARIDRHEANRTKNMRPPVNRVRKSVTRKL
jgi:hypothetical protein